MVHTVINTVFPQLQRIAALNVAGRVQNNVDEAATEGDAVGAAAVAAAAAPAGPAPTELDMYSTRTVAADEPEDEEWYPPPTRSGYGNYVIV